MQKEHLKEIQEVMLKMVGLLRKPTLDFYLQYRTLKKRLVSLNEELAEQGWSLIQTFNQGIEKFTNNPCYFLEHPSFEDSAFPSSQTTMLFAPNPFVPISYTSIQSLFLPTTAYLPPITLSTTIEVLQVNVLEKFNPIWFPNLKHLTFCTSTLKVLADYFYEVMHLSSLEVICCLEETLNLMISVACFTKGSDLSYLWSEEPYRIGSEYLSRFSREELNHPLIYPPLFV